MRPNGTGVSCLSHATLLALICLLANGGCGSSGPDVQTKRDDAPPTTQFGKNERIAVTNFPLFCVVKMICDQSESPVKEVVYCGPSKTDDPHTWVPSGDQIRDLQNVDLIVCNGPGAQFSTWIDKVTIDENKLLNTTDALDLEEFVVVKDYELVHSHGPEGEHSHSWVVSQSWLSPRIAREQATLCYGRIVNHFGPSKSFDEGFAQLQKSFDTLEAAVEKIKEVQSDVVVATSNPEASYLTRELGWEDRYLQWDKDTSPEDAKKSLAEMRDRFAKQNADAVETESLFLWVGPKNGSLSDFVEQEWEASLKIDLVETPLGSSSELDPQGYFSRMANNLEAIGAAVSSK